MTITNLTAKENNGVVVAEFESGSAKVRFTFGLEKLIVFCFGIDTNNSLQKEIVLKWLKRTTKCYINDLMIKSGNFNLQEAE